MVLLNLLMSVWARAIEGDFPGVRARCYADDARVLSGRPPAVLGRVLAATEEFARLTGMKLNIPKCHAWSCSKQGRRTLRRLFPNTDDAPTPSVVLTERNLAISPMLPLVPQTRWGDTRQAGMLAYVLRPCPCLSRRRRRWLRAQ